ncbi:hypothetical protein [Haloferula sp. A504]|uniref:hypothetical protein n=1 Tax=Haloferula sp. A504 TaxID=3373601 RepID=UPI0031BD721A|nr:hypothetical protein [Verrucomicrobiaceae bacterium E54]
MPGAGYGIAPTLSAIYGYSYEVNGAGNHQSATSGDAFPPALDWGWSGGPRLIFDQPADQPSARSKVQ